LWGVGAGGAAPAGRRESGFQFESRAWVLCAAVARLGFLARPGGLPAVAQTDAHGFDVEILVHGFVFSLSVFVNWSPNAEDPRASFQQPVLTPLNRGFAIMYPSSIGNMFSSARLGTPTT
jgi:hypothetical protein